MTKTKDPSARLDFWWPWSDWLNEGDTIASAIIIPVDGLTIGDPDVLNSGTAVRSIIEGGELGETYDVTCRVTTTAGLIDDRTMKIVIEQK